MATWPETLSSPAVDELYIAVGEGNIVRRKTQSGKEEVRRFGSGVPDIVSYYVTLTTAQYAVWRAFYKTTTKNGTEWWDAAWLASGTKALFQGYPKISQSEDVVKVSFVIIVMADADIVTVDDWAE